MPRAATTDEIRRLAHRPGVRAVAVLARGQLNVRGQHFTVLGAGPDLRGLTPSLTARSDELWSSVARGELTMSYTKAGHWRRRLGQSLVVESRHGFFPVRHGAFAALGWRVWAHVPTRPALAEMRSGAR